MKRKASALSFVFILISFFCLPYFIDTAAASGRGESGWCCRGGDVFQASPEECERTGGRYGATRREAGMGCRSEETEPMGWCCKNGRVQHQKESDCSRGGGQFFDSRRDADEHCVSEEKGWCCKKGEVFSATKDECRRHHGRYSKGRKEADRYCESQQKGWCCKNGKISKVTSRECENKRGQFFTRQNEAQRVCREEKRGWCCSKDGVFETIKKECQQRRGRLFNSRNEANRYCESQMKGWCCKDGKVSQTSLRACERKQGRFFDKQNEARRVCRDERIGWCCNKGELYEAAYHDCQNDRGRFFPGWQEALRQCDQIPQVRSLKPDTLIKGEPATLILTGQNLRDGMVLDFGPDIIVESIEVDGLKRKAEVKVFVEPMAEEMERDVILGYGNWKKEIGKVRVVEEPTLQVDPKEKGIVEKGDIPIIVWFMDYGGNATGTPGSSGQFGFKFMFKWKDGDGDLCDGQWFLSYDHGNMNGNFRDLMSSGCPPKGFPKTTHPGTDGVAEEFVYLNGKDLETVTLSFVVKDGAGNVSNKVVRKILLIELGGKASSSALIDGKPSEKGREISELHSQDKSIEKPSGKQSHMIKGVKLKKQQPMMLLAGSAGGSNNGDLVVSVKTTNETYQGDGKTLYVEVRNKSSVFSHDFSVGFCLASQINSNSQSKWLGTKKIQNLGPSNQILVSIPWQVQVLASQKDKYIAMVDIYNTVDEGKTGETNNQSKPFYYATGPLLAMPAPVGKPIEGLQISLPCKNCMGGTSGKPHQILFGPTSLIMTDSKAMALMSSYVRISLLRSNGSEVLTIAENAWFSKYYMTNSWYWLIPSSIPTGQYAIYIKSTDGHYFAKSVPFTISGPITIHIQDKPKTVLVDSMDLKDVKLSKKGYPPPGEIPLEITNLKITKLIPKAVTLAGGSFGPFARLSYLYIVLEFQANKPFKFEDSLNSTKYKDPAAFWSLVVPEVRVVGWVFPLHEKFQVYPEWNDTLMTNTTSDLLYYDPSGSYPWTKTYHVGPLLKYSKINIPKGKNTIVLGVDNPGVIHGVEVIGLALGKREVWIGITKKYVDHWYKCTQNNYPAIGVYVGFKYKPTPENKNSYLDSTFSWDTKATGKYAKKSYFFKNPIVFQTLDTTKTTKQLGFVPPWSSARKFMGKNCKPLDDALIGGW